jgi:hypothetical protein
MAAALYFSDRCAGIGLNARLLLTKLCQQLGLGKTIGTGGTPRSETLKKTYMGWYFAIFRIVFDSLPASLIASVIKRGLPKVKADHELVEHFETSISRSTVRGTSGAAWETAQDTCFDWGLMFVTCTLSMRMSGILTMIMRFHPIRASG